ncbi:hypothetical protein JTE90_004748 [Oedothorax gibbosus]|uniref:Cytokine-like nuclear factor N-PAC n=1 Tax=Oedothorax gibbosus TaxID=931172 RepID=A0AAV6TT48_9ARAC|nr:hypothetical protein JTE90_004748 [Oedothorax gibbosus]
MAKDFTQEDLVWAKMKGYPPWPARVASPPDGKIPKSKKPQHYVFFFGTHDHAWITDENIDPHSELKLESARAYKKKSSAMLLAIEEIEEAQKTVKKTSSKEKEPIAVDTPPSPSSPPQPQETPKSTEKPKKKLVIKKKRDSVKASEKKTPKRSPKKRSASDAHIDASKGDDSDADFQFLMANVPPNNRHLESSGDVSQVLSCVNGFDASGTTSVVLSQTSAERIKGGILSPSDKKIGFLGLGAMGTAMVEQLLATKHDVTVWNRTKRGEHSALAGARTAETPADVVEACDITLCCLDGAAVEEVVFSRMGVLEGLDGGGKAYVEMSSIPPAMSQRLSEAVCGRGGRYLEAQLVGERRGVADRSLVVICAGDRGTFLDCDTLFATWSTAAFYVGPDAGYASKIALLLKMLSGVSCAALSESMAMLQQCGVRPQLLMEVLGSGPCNFPLLMRNGAAMAEGGDPPAVRTPVKHAKRDLAMAVKLGDGAQQPLQLAVAATDAYVRAAANDPDADVASIHQNTYRYIDPKRLTTTEMWTKLV